MGQVLRFLLGRQAPPIGHGKAAHGLGTDVVAARVLLLDVQAPFIDANGRFPLFDQERKVENVFDCLGKGLGVAEELDAVQFGAFVSSVHFFLGPFFEGLVNLADQLFHGREFVFVVLGGLLDVFRLDRFGGFFVGDTTLALFGLLFESDLTFEGAREKEGLGNGVEAHTRLHAKGLPIHAAPVESAFLGELLDQFETVKAGDLSLQ